MKTETETWNIQIRLGNWTGDVQIQKDDFPEAIDAHSFAMNAIKSSAQRIIKNRSYKEGK